MKPTKKQLQITQENLTPEDQYVLAVEKDKARVFQFRSPNLFNWLIGLTSIVLGFAFFLTVRSFEAVRVGNFASWLLPIQASFILSGIGLILSEMIETERKGWRIIFRLLISLTLTALAIIFWQKPQVDLTLVMMWLAIVILINVVTDISSLRSFLIYHEGLLLGLFGVAFFTTSGLLHTLLFQISAGLVVVQILIFAVLIAYVIISWVAYFRNKIVLARLNGVVSVIFAGLSLVYANAGEWAAAMLFLITALIAFLLPFWDELRFRYAGKGAPLVTRMFGIVAALFLTTIVLLKILQNILVTNASIFLEDKVIYGRILVESTVQSAVASIGSLAEGDIFMAALTGKKINDLNDLSRSFFESNRSLWRIVAVDTKGIVVSVYPFTEGMTGSSLANTSYFQSATASRKAVVSNVLLPGTLAINGPTVALAVPSLDKNNNVIGVLIGYLNLSALSDRLGEIATPSLSEYFVVMDKDNRWLIGPDVMANLSGDPVTSVLTQKGILKEGYVRDGELVLASYQSIPSLGWSMTLVQPYFYVLAVSQTAYLVVLLVVSLSVLIISLTILAERTGQVHEVVELSRESNEK